MHLHFLGANRQVTGSRYLLEAGGLNLLIDCGLFQERQFLERNWEKSPIDPSSIDFLLLTHAHLDHVGLVPRLVKQGFSNPILTVEPSVQLAEIILQDAGRIQEEEAEYKKKRHRKEGRRGRHPEVPLYTADDAEKAFPLFRGIRFHEAVTLNERVSMRFHEAGHILGSAILEIEVNENGRRRRLVFSGDLGQWNTPLVNDPELLGQADYVVVESTYGDRNHKEEGPIEEQLAEIINDTVQRAGNVVIPTFAVERAQELLYYIGRLIHSKQIPPLLVFLDSPMAVNVTEVFRRYKDYLDEDTRNLVEQDTRALGFAGLKLVRNTEDSKAINQIRGSSIILAGSGMCTAGRIKHHLKSNLNRPESTILFVGYQASGTLGRQIIDGKKEVRIHGRFWPVRARVARIHGLSAHGDRDDLLRWLGGFREAPERLFLTHGEEHASESLGDAVQSKLGWEVRVPQYGEIAEFS